MPKSETVTLLKSLDQQVKGIDHQVKSLDQQFKGLDHQVKSLDQQFKGLDHQVKSLDQQFKGLDHQVKSLDQQFKGLDHQVKNLDQRVGTIEQILPTLATRQDLYDGLREEGERSRRYMTMLAEDLRETVNRSLDGHLGHTQRLEEHRVRLDGHDAAIGAIDVRLTDVERTPRRSS